MRKLICLLALLSFLAPLAVHAAEAVPQSPAAPSALDSAIAVSQILSPQELMVTAQPAVQLDAYFRSMSSGGTDKFPLGKICSISCRPCISSCPPGEGSCQFIQCP